MVATILPAGSIDSAITTQLRTELADTNRPNLRQLAVDLSQGQVTVRGTVDSFYEKQLAIHACQAVLGSEQWVDAVEVR